MTEEETGSLSDSSGRSLYVGVDGGGSHTRAVLAGEDLAVRGRGEAGPANASSATIRRVAEAISKAVDAAIDSGGVSVDRVSRILVGAAGVETDPVRERLTEILAPRYGAGRLAITTDARIALAGATKGDPEGPGVVIISGTGAIAFGRNAAGEEARAGGWGPLVGDEGSRYAIARKGLAAALRAIDGRGPETAIRELLYAAEGIRLPKELTRKVYRPGVGPSDIAAYFPLVLEAARQGDAVARQIFDKAGEELALAVNAVVRRLDLCGETFPVSCVGGAFAAGDLLLAPLAARIEREAPRARIGPPAYPPEIGAVRLAIAGKR
jgi:N-acetylmuramic acid 6-phosphate etherase